MHLLYSNILPLKAEPSQNIFIDYFRDAIAKADSVEIAVGYASKNSLKELEELQEEYKIKNMVVVIGMYYLEGMPEGIYHAAMDLNERLKQKGIGEIRLSHVFKYHGKLYAFYKNGKPIAGIVGSNNLGAIKPEAANLRQYEVAMATEEENEIHDISELIKNLYAPKCSVNIEEAKDIPLIREINRALVGQEFVSKITQDEVAAYQSKITEISFEIPLKVPADENDTKMRGSNINVCYASGRKRVWWETEIVVEKAIRGLPGYPEYQKPFMAVTDDGWKFLVWTCGDNNKNLYSKDDLKIMGRWIKGRLVSAGLVEPVNQVEKDKDSKGVITGVMLSKYGRDTITLTKTSLRTTLEDGKEVDVWMLSFLPESKNTKEEQE